MGAERVRRDVFTQNHRIAGFSLCLLTHPHLVGAQESFERLTRDWLIGQREPGRVYTVVAETGIVYRPWLSAACVHTDWQSGAGNMHHMDLLVSGDDIWRIKGLWAGHSCWKLLFGVIFNCTFVELKYFGIGSLFFFPWSKIRRSPSPGRKGPPRSTVKTRCRALVPRTKAHQPSFGENKNVFYLLIKWSRVKALRWLCLPFVLKDQKHT